MDHYELLDVSADATAEEIRLAYVRLAKRVHPDSGGSAALFRQVEEAYRVLSDAGERRRYDRERLNPRAGQRPRGAQVVTPQDLAEAVIRSGSTWAKGVVGKRAERRAAELLRLQAEWPKSIGLDFLRVDLKSWLPLLNGAIAEGTRCVASWARKDVVEPAINLTAVQIDPGTPPHRIIWRVDGTEREWVSWRTGSEDGGEVELMLRFAASPGARPKWARRHFPAGTHMIVTEWHQNAT